MSDPHALLGLPAGASAQQIKRAFRKLAMQWHPDRNPDPAAAEQFRRLRDAHDRLLATLQELIMNDTPSMCDDEGGSFMINRGGGVG